MAWGQSLGLLRAILFNVLFFIYILQLYLPIPKATLILSIFSFLAFIISLPGISLFYLLVIILSLSLSVVLMVTYDLFHVEALTYFSGMTNILVLLAYASLFAIPVLLGEYPQKIYQFFKKRVNSYKSMYATFSLVTFILCSVMSASAIPTIQTTLSKFLKELPQTVVSTFQSMTFVRPFIMTLFWTPVAAVPTITISGTGASATIVLAITFTLAVLFLMVDICTSYFRLRGELDGSLLKAARDDRHSLSEKNNTQLLYFLITIFLFIILVISLSQSLGFSMLDAVVMTIIPYSFLWSLTLRKGGQYVGQIKTRLRESVPKIYPQVALFVSISLLINVIGRSGINDVINQTIQHVSQFAGPFILVIISLVVFLLSWTGMIPQLVVVLTIQTLNLQYMNITPEWLALAIIGGALAGSASSPFTMNANIVAVTIGDTAMEVVKKNQLFALMIFIVTAILAVTLEVFSPIRK